MTEEEWLRSTDPASLLTAAAVAMGNNTESLARDRANYFVTSSGTLSSLTS